MDKENMEIIEQGIKSNSEYPCGFINEKDWAIFYMRKDVKREVIEKTLQMFLACVIK